MFKVIKFIYNTFNMPNKKMNTSAIAKTIATSAIKQATGNAINTAVNTAVKAVVPIATKRVISSMTSSKKKGKANAVKPSTTNRSTKRFAPVAYSTSFTNSGKSIRIAQSEIIATISPATKSTGWWPFKKDEIMPYTALTFPINPSNITTFPWLSQIAGLFDKYRFRKLSFTFVSTKPTNTKGNIAMAYDFDAYDSVPEDIVGLSNLAKFTTTPVYVNKTIEMPVNHPGEKSWYYCADGSNGDLKTYNVGKFYLALVGAADMDTHGYIVANYDVDLVDKNPKLRTVQTVVDPTTGATSYEIYQDVQPATQGSTYYDFRTLDRTTNNTENVTLYNLPGQNAAFEITGLNEGDTVSVAVKYTQCTSVNVGGINSGFTTTNLDKLTGYNSGNDSSGGTFFYVGTATGSTASIEIHMVPSAQTSIYYTVIVSPPPAPRS